jgi:hypothetical protein
MAKLFLFAIGGTGSRVVKALTMLMAAGVPIKNTDAIVPIIIDPDTSNGDLTRTIELLKTYKEIREKGASDSSDFFKTMITSLDELGDGGYVSDNFKFDIDGVKEQLFKEFIGYSELDRNNKAFASLLFSAANLNADMEVGFKGNPNIGSVVLNKFKDAPFFRKFASSFEEQDRVFIISSIFGGTGAAGFPLLLKNIRDAAPPTPRHHYLQRAKVGAVTVLPYFSVDKVNGVTIDSNSFITKTKAALSYYAHNMTGDSSRAINALYYIGDKVTNDQKGADGSNDQKNKAHFIELAAALSIIDFMSLDDNKLQVADDRKAVNPRFFEFGLASESMRITFSDLARQTYDLIARPLTRFSLFRSFMDHHYQEFAGRKGEAWANHGNNKLTPEELDGRYRDEITAFNRHYTEWLNEMAASNVGFAGIDTSKKGKDIYNLVNGMPTRKDFFKRIMDSSGVDNYLKVLSKSEPALDHLRSTHKLLALFSAATSVITNKELNL